MEPSNPNENNVGLDVVVELGRKAGETLQTFTEQIVAERDRAYRVRFWLEWKARQSVAGW